MEKTVFKVPKKCNTCKHHAEQNFTGDGPKIVCVKEVPRTMGVFVNNPQGVNKPPMFYFETYYPIPPIACSQHEEEPKAPH